MAKTAGKKLGVHSFLVAGLAAWLIPGAGHVYLGRPVRAVVLFVIIGALFWSGVAIGGVFTVNPREEKWWSRAQLCNGLSGVISYHRQNVAFEPYWLRADKMIDAESRNRDQQVLDRARALLANDELALVAPAAAPAYVFTGVAGMLNLLCIMDVVLLCALGHRGETPVAASKEEASA